MSIPFVAAECAMHSFQTFGQQLGNICSSYECSLGTLVTHIGNMPQTNDWTCVVPFLFGLQHFLYTGLWKF